MTPEEKIQYLERELHQIKLSLNCRIQGLVNELIKTHDQLDEQIELNQQLQQRTQNTDPKPIQTDGGLGNISPPCPFEFTDDTSKSFSKNFENGVRD